jgi:hypothetical protein
MLIDLCWFKKGSKQNSKDSDIFLPSKNTTYINQQLENIYLKSWQYVSAVKSQKRTHKTHIRS